MLRKPLAFVLREANALKGTLANMSCYNGEVEDDKETSEFAPPALDTTMQGSLEVQRAPKSSERREHADEHRETDLNTEQAAESSDQTALNLTHDGSVGGDVDDSPIYSGNLVKRMGNSFKHVANGCYAVIPSTEHDSEADDIFNRTIALSTRMAELGPVQKAVFEEAASHPSFLVPADKLGKDMMALINSMMRNSAESGTTEMDAAEIEGAETGLEESGLDDTDVVDESIATSKEKNDGSRETAAPGAIPWYKRFLDALKKLCQRLHKLGAQAINLVVGKIMSCFNVAKAIAQRIFRAIKMALLWIRKAIVNPHGQIREILDDPEEPSCAKALGVIGVVATAIVGALILAFGFADVGPYGVGAAAVSAAAAAFAASRTAPNDRKDH